MKELTERKCKVCSAPFMAKRKDAKYCNGNCRFQAHWVKKKKKEAKLLREAKKQLKESKNV